MSENNNPIIESWLEKADHDLGSAKVLFLHLPTYHDIIAFHCQQAVEKYLKAALIHNNTQFQKRHDLVYLLELLSVNVEISSEFYTKALNLNDYGVEMRYPNETLHLTNADLEEAILIADEFKVFVISILV